MPVLMDHGWLSAQIGGAEGFLARMSNSWSRLLRIRSDRAVSVGYEPGGWAVACTYSSRGAVMVDHITIRSFALYAEQRLALGRGNRVMGGDIGVRSRSRDSGSAQLIMGAHSRSWPDQTVIAPSVALGDDVECGRILADELIDDGIPLRSEHPFPASAMPALPLASATSAGSQAVTVAEGQVSALTPGSYGDLTVYGSLVLNPGDYIFSAITIGHHATVAAAGTVRVIVANYLSASRGAQLHPLFDQAAEQLLVLVAGTDTATAVPAVSLGEHAEVRALLGVPHGTVALADHVHVTGAVAGYFIVTGEDVEVRHQGGFPEESPGQHGSQQLSGAYGVPPEPGTDPVAGPVPADTGITLAIGLPVQDSAGLQALIASVSDPNSAQFRHYITPAAFNETYGATSSDYQALQDWANAAGFHTIATFPNRLLLRVTGTAAQVQQALYVNLLYRERNDGSLFVATDREPSLDLSVPVLEINGLGDAVPLARAAVNGTGTGNSYAAADLRNAYLGVGSPLQALDGTGQNVGIIDFLSYSAADVTGYFNNQQPAQGEGTTLPAPNVTPVTVEASPSPPPNSLTEANLDVEMVWAMAPRSSIFVFQGTTDDTGGMDAVLHKMATSTPQLSVASCSLVFGFSQNSQQALEQMALQGTSFFTASGDSGDVGGNVAGSTKMEYQTLVGGTILSTSAPTSAGGVTTYPVPYYAGEATWPNSGGGVISDTAIPDYQVNIMQVDAATNGGSTSHRNYPDVAMLAQNAEIYSGGSLQQVAGTSVAAPLWAGFTALANQMSELNAAGQAGFLNRTLYDIGMTAGNSGNADLYALCFNDIKDDVSNGLGNGGSGFRSVAGYDLVTGLGTPTPALIYQLANLHPTTPVECTTIRFIIGTGGDDLRNDSTSTADVFLKNGEEFTLTLKAKNAGTWNNGSITTLDLNIPSSVTLPTPTEGLSGVRINLIQGGSFPETADNWDINTLQVSIATAGGPQICQLNLVGTDTLQDGSTGLIRLSQNAGSSGSGPSSPVYATGPAGGC
jgi:hypothetical protein